jgi:hypothetical protein
MTNENKLEVKEKSSAQLEESSNNITNLSSFEKKMLEHGWKPDGELSAEEWIDNGFKVKNKKLDSLFQTVERLKDKLARQEQDIYARAKAELEAKRIEAIELADVERVKQIEDQTRQLLDPSVKEHADAFIMKHQAWFNGTSYRDQEMQLVCKSRDKELIEERLPPDKHFEKLEEFMKGKYPDYFKVDPDPIINAVEGKQQSAIKSSHKKKITFDDLDEYQKNCARNLLKTRGISIDDYIKKLMELDNR